MAQAWPSGVPEWALAGSLSERVEVNVAEFQPEVGPPVRRRRTSVPTTLLSFEQVLTPAQYATLYSWYTSTLKDGSLSFNLTHPRTGTATECVFVSPPEYSEQTLGALRVSYSLRTLP